VAETGGIDDLHLAIVAAVAPVLDQWGFALAGGNALRAYGLTSRPTMDVNLYSNVDGAVDKVADDVGQALQRAGFRVERVDTLSELEDWPELADYNAEWTVYRDRRQVMVQLGIRGRTRPTVQLDVIPAGHVLAVEDVLAGKVLALASRAEARDFIDVAAAMAAGWTPEQLIQLALQMEPGYELGEFRAIGLTLDAVPDRDFHQYGMTGTQIGRLREAFLAWPRNSRLRWSQPAAPLRAPESDTRQHGTASQSRCSP
jgi:hypothetical protein